MRAAGRVVLSALVVALVGCTAGTPQSGSTTSTPTTSAAPPASTAQSPTPPHSAGPASFSSAVEPSPSSGVGSASGIDQPAAPRVISTVASGLTTPWGLAPLTDGSALVTERDTGKVLRITAGGRITDLGTVDGVRPSGEGGLLGIVAPSADRALVYLTAEQDNRIVELTLAGDRITGQRPILTGIPKAGNHDGGRLAIGPDGLLYIGTGDAATTTNAQDLNSLGGKILRTTLDGKPAPGNPFPQAPLVYSYGHRNVQGLAFDDQDRLWASEFGQNTWDELNLIEAGDNDGWPTVEGRSDDPDFVSPQQVWPTDQASPSGLAYLDGSLWMAGLRGERLWQIPVHDGRSATPVAHFTEQYGRLRTVVAMPDGSLWLTTSNTDGRGDPKDGDDRILRLTVS